MKFKTFLSIALGTFLLFSCGSKRVVSESESISENKTPRALKIKKPDVTNEKDEETKVVVVNSTQEYINYYSSIAKEEMRLYGIPASITLAQGILESGSGKGRLAIKANNHFGIKCHDWTGAKIYHDDDRSQECFRKYNNAKYSFRDHSLFLKHRSRYSKLFSLRKSDYKGWARELKAAGYATDRKYPAKLISLIERYNLDKFDKEVLGGSSVVVNMKTHVVSKGDTLYSISKLYNVTIERLQKANDLSGTSIEIGQELIID